jgi:hypothetical protein
MLRSNMRISSLVVVALVLSFAHAGAGQQSTVKGPAGWVLPRTADGRPDLEGVWENNSATPLERPAQLAQTPRLSDAELARLEQRARTLLGPNAEAVFGDALYLTLLADTRPGGLGATGSYSQNWLPDRYFEHRTSLITDPADGKLPLPTPAGAKARAAFRFGEVADSAQKMTLQDRCVHYGFPDLFAGYMSVYRITQSPQSVAIQMEKIHDARIIPLDGRAHVSPAIRQYLGDSRGHWEGDTLVVETTHLVEQTDQRYAHSDQAKIVERYSLATDSRGTKVLTAEMTLTDPVFYSKPVTDTKKWAYVPNGHLLPYECAEEGWRIHLEELEKKQSKEPKK